MKKLVKLLGPYLDLKKKIINNLKYSNIGENDHERNKIIKDMWGNYGRILAEYPYLKKFNEKIYDNYISIEGLEYLEEIKKNKKKVVFVSGHFNNFELMAMQIENYGIDLAAIYRPLNNIFLNKTMEKIRENHICKIQIKKGKSGTRDLLEYFKKGYSIALMIDQRVSEGLQVKFFNNNAYTTTIPAQLAKKYNCEIVPVYIYRLNKSSFKMTVYKPIVFEKDLSIENITQELNYKLEKMIIKNPEQWIWSHNRWK